MNPNTDSQESNNSSNFNILGRNHTLINDPRTKVLNEIARRLELAAIDYSNVQWGNLTTD